MVKRVIAERQETKILPVLGIPQTMLAKNTYVFNPAYQVGQGVGSGSRIGRKTNNMVMNYGFRALMLGTSPLGTAEADTVHLRELHLRSRVVDTAGVASSFMQINPAGLTTGDVFYHSAEPMSSPVDKNRWTCTFDKTYTLWDNPNNGATLPTERELVVKKHFMRVGKRQTYRDDTVPNSQLTQGAVYLVFVCDYNLANANIDFGVELFVTGILKWKDA